MYIVLRGLPDYRLSCRSFLLVFDEISVTMAEEPESMPRAVSMRYRFSDVTNSQIVDVDDAARALSEI